MKFFLVVLALFSAGCVIVISPQQNTAPEATTDQTSVGANLCAGAPVVPSKTTENWQRYEDPKGRFELYYPPDWTQTDASTEVQFWDDVSDGINSIKVVLYDEPLESFQDIKNNVPYDYGVLFERSFYETTINDTAMLIESGYNPWGDYRTYYYRLKGDILSITAMFHDENQTVRCESLILQASFKPLE